MTSTRQAETTARVDLAQVERRCLASLLDLLELHGFGHTGGSLSVLQMLVALYFDVARVDPQQPRWPDRDRIVLSKAHACEAMYAVLAERGFFPRSRFAEYLAFGSMLQGHAERLTPGVEYSGGSLGQGLSFGIGLAYAARLRGQSHRVYCLLGDGECHEGSVWEAAMAASHYGLSNLYALVDFNHYADHDDVDRLMSLQPFDARWRSFGWETIYVPDGNDTASISRALRSFSSADRPKCLIANTAKNFGVPLWEQDHLHQAAGDLLARGIAQARQRLEGLDRVTALGGARP